MTDGVDGPISADSESAAWRLLGETMREWRVRAGLSLQGLHAHLHYSKQTLSDYENAKVRPSAAVLAECERLFAAPPGLLTGLRDRANALRAARVQGVGTVATLPPPMSDFTDREPERARLRALAASALTAADPVIALLHGPPAVGKSSLAVELGHRLSGYRLVLRAELSQNGRPLAAERVAHRLLATLGVLDADIPEEPARRSALLRTLLAHRGPAILILDDAGDAAQVQPLLPHKGPALVLVTSRRRLAGVAVSEAVRLDPFDRDASGILLRRLIGERRCEAEPEAAERVIDSCGGIPMALRGAAFRCGEFHPDWPLSHLADLLGDADTRLHSLDSGDLGLLAGHDIAYEALSPAARLLLRRWNLAPGPGVTASIAAMLTGGPDAARALAELAAASLITPTATVGMYQAHDIVADYAAHRLRLEETAQERREAGDAYRDRLLDTATRHGRLLALGAAADAHQAAARSWLDVHFDHVLALVTTTPVEPGTARDLLDAVNWYLDLRCRWHEAGTLATALTAVAERADDDRLRMACHGTLGLAAGETQQLQRAAEHHRVAHRLAMSRGAVADAVESLGYLGNNLRDLGDFTAAAEHHTTALDLARGHRDPTTIAAALNRLGATLTCTGDHDAALAALHEAREVWHAIGATRPLAMAHYRLSVVHAATGRAGEAVEHARRAARLFAEHDDAWGTAAAAQALGVAISALGHHDEAADHLATAAGIFGELGDRVRQAQTLRALTGVHTLAGRGEEAAAVAAQAREVLLRLEETPLIAAELAGEPPPLV
ncbi:hypothetical protein Afil01_28880 [Actinorhabdospora filicis]|uniref:HTH cro/C1-type domain-containing protein n=1 Tax=Actinorhabdospora filicis TaxID=1785913 RepID=A0A9W6W9Z9_9ACTN|nr:tetratricopeptide repeat protein [Actinorhabdospora filicis]GLZ78081.1 hypothetical protein Afil01_28880 [Actinorhabdospora filicis]